MKHLVTLAALSLCTSVLAQSVISDGSSSRIISRDGSTVSAGTITSRDGSSVSSGNITSRDGSSVSSGTITSRNGGTVSSNTSSGNAGSVILDNQSSVTSSVTTDGTGATTRSITGRTGSMCSAGQEGQRCEISCQAPQVAQCGNGSNGEPVCFCK
jgi:hypothetical protein